MKTDFENATKDERAAALAELGLELRSTCVKSGKADIPGIQKGEPSEFQVTLTRNGKDVLTTTYTKGCGLRVTRMPGAEKYIDAHGIERTRPRYKRIPSVWGKPSPEVRAALEKSVPEPVELVEFCYCMALDAQAGSQTFAEFCGESGYDEDSRKAFDTYMACQKIATELRRGGVSVEKLSDICQGY